MFYLSRTLLQLDLATLIPYKQNLCERKRIFDHCRTNQKKKTCALSLNRIMVVVLQIYCAT